MLLDGELSFIIEWSNDVSIYAVKLFGLACGEFTRKTLAMGWVLFKSDDAPVVIAVGMLGGSTVLFYAAGLWLIVCSGRVVCAPR